MDNYTNVRLPLLILHRRRMYRLSQTAGGGLVLKAVEPEQDQDLDRERGDCVIVAPNQTPGTKTPGGA